MCIRSAVESTLGFVAASGLSGSALQHQVWCQQFTWSFAPVSPLSRLCSQSRSLALGFWSAEQEEDQVTVRRRTWTQKVCEKIKRFWRVYNFCKRRRYSFFYDSATSVLIKQDCLHTTTTTTGFCYSIPEKWRKRLINENWSPILFYCDWCNWTLLQEAGEFTQKCVPSVTPHLSSSCVFLFTHTNLDGLFCLRVHTVVNRIFMSLQ